MARNHILYLAMLNLIQEVLGLDCVSPVKSCPCSKMQWEKRSVTFNCTGLIYTCMLTTRNDLVEACVPEHPVPPAASGCPLINGCYNSIPTTVIAADFKPCPTNQTGCPPANHSGYFLTELYQYSECIRNNKSNQCKSKRVINNPNSKKRVNVAVILGILIPVLFLVITVVLITIYKRRRQKDNVSIHMPNANPGDNVSIHMPNANPGDNVSIHMSNANPGDNVSDRMSNVDPEDNVPVHMSNVNTGEEKVLRSRNTPLSEAIFHGKVSVVDLLLKAGADVEELNKEGGEGAQNGDTPLSDAIFHGNEDIVAVLLKAGADFEKLNQYGDTPLSQAIFHGREGVVALLLKAGADFKKLNKDGCTPLSHDSFLENEGVVAPLLTDGADFKELDEEH